MSEEKKDLEEQDNQILNSNSVIKKQIHGDKRCTYTSLTIFSKISVDGHLLILSKTFPKMLLPHNGFMLLTTTASTS